jgi:hypothetical protein
MPQAGGNTSSDETAATDVEMGMGVDTVFGFSKEISAVRQQVYA